MSETLCAFANMPDGGSIVLGVDEAAGRFEVTGLTDIAAIEAGIVHQARNSVSPSPQLMSQEFAMDGKQVLVLHVAPLPTREKPATTQGIAYLRQSGGDYPMHEHELRMLEVAKLHLDEQVEYDLKVASGLDIDDLVPELVDHYVAACRNRDRRLRGDSTDAILRATSVLTRTGEPTLAGLYALGHYPQGHHPALTVTAAVQMRGGEGRPRNRNLTDFTGPLPTLLGDLMAWTHENLDVIHAYRTDGHMEEQPELPMNAVRELLANALVHRDLGPNTLGTGKAIQVRLTPDALLVQSPGGLRGVSLSQLESDDHAQAAVNQRLYHMAKKLTTPDGASVIEGEGGGIREVFRSTASRGLSRPRLINTGVQFTALLWRPSNRDTAETLPAPNVDEQPTKPITSPISASSKPTLHEATVLEIIVNSPQGISLRDLEKLTGLSSRQVRYALQQPLTEGLVTMDGGRGRRDTVYRRTK